jgi:hypothetical protein
MIFMQSSQVNTSPCDCPGNGTPHLSQIVLPINRVSDQQGPQSPKLLSTASWQEMHRGG